MKLESRPAPFGFHCIICFEDFNLNDRPPVVLPCGHTYVCELCAKRLKKCMECRASLFKKLPAPSHLPPTAPASPLPRSGQGFRRYSGSHVVPSSPKKRPPVEQFALPIPRNVVLIALMESAAREKSLLDEKDENGTTDYDQNNEVNDSITKFSSVCGTYVVREREGLVVQGTNPNLQEERSNCRSASAIDLFSTMGELKLSKEHSINSTGTILNNTESPKTRSKFIPSLLSRGGSLRKSENAGEPKSPSDNSVSSSSFAEPLKQPTVIGYGQKVQVVDFNSGVARLARNQGYIIATTSQLVKIGAPIEKGCQMEGMINSSQKERLELERKLAQLTEMEKTMSNKLNDILSKPEEYPVIGEPMTPGSHHANDDYMQPSLSPGKNMRHTSIDHISSSDSDTISSCPLSPLSPPSINGYNRPNGETTEHAVFLDVENSNSTLQIPTISITAGLAETQHTVGRSLLCTSVLPSRSGSTDEDDQIEAVELKYRSAAVSAVPSHFRPASAERISRINSEERSESRTGLDFRTGLSGHFALTSTRRKDSRSSNSREVRFMGDHRGIAAIKRIRPSGNSSSPGLKSEKTW
mmetsp:Transcript_7205/g.10324  ORF Transcript_7205/g.10324 Transcript_7205/m.10324 type:complete len:583 (-) Transcript_7205:126-1874(-)|eukprot:CAMPEP_0184864182 /NCGR_PEP_ID=MMETSP0580-20130426/14072_1 /TAXON_ID=1118495 /ORGANISM="Dactyliosolen fragilissimus" /LENGTH=582 /DNA_ID=CAMNT_0027362867 /DNA_START=34 /DNA_END=1782 /DNA_ORIENTATION=+